MSWYSIIIITTLVYWTIGVILVMIDEDWACCWAMGLLYPILKIILYPIAAWTMYSRHKEWYEKRGVSRFQYMLGKRVNKKNIKINIIDDKE